MDTEADSAALCIEQFEWHENEGEEESSQLANGVQVLDDDEDSSSDKESDEEVDYDSRPSKRTKWSDDENDEDEEDYEDEDSSDFDVDDLLEKGLEESVVRKRKRAELDTPQPHEERKKMVLRKRDQDYFEVLPEGWIEVTHFSGMPVYLHKQSRVCTMSKPYHLGPGSARKHEIPISAIPCFQYRKELDKDSYCKSQVTNIDGNENQDSPSLDITNGHCPFKNEPKNTEIELKSQGKSGHTSIIAKVESVKENNKLTSLNFMSVRDYCQKLFEFQEITIRKFKTWSDRRKHMQARKLKQRPSLPEGTKLITCPLPKSSETGEMARNNRKEFVMNPAGKSSVCILHEFVQHAERVQPQYRFQELENASMPYSATVIIKGMEYGVGFGSSKKQAKSEAARESLEILIPAIKELASDNTKATDGTAQDLSYFDDIEITDSRVSDLCATAGQYSPYQILVECLKRNFGMGDTDITTSVKLLKHQKNEFTMNVGTKHSATVHCRNKREGKQRAAQSILAKLHPHIKFWGPLLRLYGRGSCKTPKEKKEEEQKITELQSTACANKPNYAILKKLKDEMEKLREDKDTFLAINDTADKDNNNETSACPASNLKHINL